MKNTVQLVNDQFAATRIRTLPDMGMARAEVFIERATLAQCAEIQQALIERVSTLIGCCPKLEDGLCEIRNELENESCQA